MTHLTTVSQNILNLKIDFKELELCKWQVMSVMGLWRTENLLCCATVLFIKDEITLRQCYNAFFFITSIRNCKIHTWSSLRHGIFLISSISSSPDQFQRINSTTVNLFFNFLQKVKLSLPLVGISDSGLFCLFT